MLKHSYTKRRNVYTNTGHAVALSVTVQMWADTDSTRYWQLKYKISSTVTVRT